MAPGVELYASSSPYYPVFALINDLGYLNATASPVVFAMGVLRSPSISFVTYGSTSKAQVQNRGPLFIASGSPISDIVREPDFA